MRAKDIMVTEVITVGPQASVRDVAKLLLSNRIGAVPVVDEHGELIGIISEGDLARRAELDTDRHRSWWLEMFSRKSKEALAKEYIKSRGTKVKDVMTKNVIMAKPTTSGRDIATLLEKHRIKRVPIVAKGKMIGIVSRANLIQALASLPEDDERSTISDAREAARVAAELVEGVRTIENNLVVLPVVASS
jgi:CBS domain-containing protein